MCSEPIKRNQKKYRIKDNEYYKTLGAQLAHIKIVREDSSDDAYLEIDTSPVERVEIDKVKGDELAKLYSEVETLEKELEKSRKELKVSERKIKSLIQEIEEIRKEKEDVQKLLNYSSKKNMEQEFQINSYLRKIYELEDKLITKMNLIEADNKPNFIENTQIAKNEQSVNIADIKAVMSNISDLDKKDISNKKEEKYPEVEKTGETGYKKDGQTGKRVIEEANKIKTIDVFLNDKNKKKSKKEDDSSTNMLLKKSEICLDSIDKNREALESKNLNLLEKLNARLEFEVNMQSISEHIKSLKESDAKDAEPGMLNKEIMAIIKRRASFKEDRNNNAKEMLEFIKDIGNYDSVVRFYLNIDREKDCIQVFQGFRKLLNLDDDEYWDKVVAYEKLGENKNLFFKIIDKSGEQITFEHNATDDTINQVNNEELKIEDICKIDLDDVVDRYKFIDRKLEALEILSGENSPLLQDVKTIKGVE